MAYKFKQGYFIPKHPEKVMKYPEKKITYRSSWELHFFEFLDNNPNVIKWGSEIIAIPYIKPTDNKIHRYYPDVYVEFKDKNGNIKKEMIEIKPKKQLSFSRTRDQNKRLVESITLAINKAKWLACQTWCKQNGIEFKIATENSIFS